MSGFEVAAGAVGFAGFALQSVQQLASVIGDIKNAPEELAGIRREVSSLEAVLISIREEFGRNDTVSDASVRHGSGLPIYLDACGKDCQKWQQKIKGWTSHSTDGHLSKRDTLNVALVHKSTLKGFGDQLLQHKTALNLGLQMEQHYLSTARDANFVRASQQIVSQFSEDKERVESKLDQLQARFDDLQGLGTSDVVEAKLRDLRDQEGILKTAIKFYEQATTTLNSDAADVKQKIGKVTTEKGSQAEVGIVNTATGRFQMDQTIGDVSTSDGSNAFVGYRTAATSFRPRGTNDIDSDDFMKD
ncbi:hypothetical protein K461DRAFT_320635 [Myriangium duriaei CBS 260.36]|uniref:Azaphilone pigments biosynthesis cluster protein L N-terminal domain-containing protein n=1 Tax=Myriangium duriaei CBS 260.36 TaxID=1168546 RepID=A0A9P4J0C8_9PEZI|nr:hypothetical protein K461DRAFT_320635 [Myriangium duriaei CBS 260.36]